MYDNSDETSAPASEMMSRLVEMYEKKIESIAKAHEEEIINQRLESLRLEDALNLSETNLIIMTRKYESLLAQGSIEGGSKKSNQITPSTSINTFQRDRYMNRSKLRSLSSVQEARLQASDLVESMGVDNLIALQVLQDRLVAEQDSHSRDISTLTSNFETCRLSALLLADEQIIATAKLSTDQIQIVAEEVRRDTIAALELSESKAITALLISNDHLVRQAHENLTTALKVAAIVESDRLSALIVADDNVTASLKIGTDMAMIVAENVRQDTSSALQLSATKAADVERDHIFQLIKIKDDQANARDKFIRYVFHELRVPFHSIAMSMDLLNMETSEYSTDIKDTIRMLTQACRSMKAILNDTLDYAKMEKGMFHLDPRPSSMARVISNSIETMKPFALEIDEHMTIEVVTDPLLVDTLLFDRNLMQQVLCNLMSNAIKFAPARGEGVVSLSSKVIDITKGYDLQTDALLNYRFPGVVWKAGAPSGKANSVEVCPPGPISMFDTIASGEQHYTIIIRIQDNGEGIQPEYIETLFTPFRQLDPGSRCKTKGSGLGLAICWEIVSLHRGRIGVRSTGKSGDGFEVFLWFSLPVTVGKLDIPLEAGLLENSIVLSDQLISRTRTFSTLKILIVDDVLSNRKLLERLIVNHFKSIFHGKSTSIVVNGTRVHIESLEVTLVEDGHFAVGKVLGLDLDSIEDCRKTSALPPDAKINKTSLGFYDAITMDAQMPALDGFTTTQILRSAGYCGVLYGCTGNSMESDRQLFLKSGADQVFIKPVPVLEMFRCMISNVVSTWLVKNPE